MSHNSHLWDFRDYVALTKYFFYTPDKMITIPKDKIMTITNASEEMIKSYTHLAKMYEKSPMMFRPKRKL